MDHATASKRMGKPRRSKGCTTCIQRKVKCDEKVPSCGQCLKGGRKCSGIASAIFLNMDSTTLSTTSTFAPRDAVESPQSTSSPESTITFDESTSPKSIDTVFTKRRKAEVTSKSSLLKSAPHQLLENSSSLSPRHNFWVLPLTVKTSQVSSHQVLSHFINYFARAAPKDVIFNSWMTELPEMLASPKRASTSKAIAAASMIYYGRRTNDKAIIMEAYKCYGSGLSIQRKTLEEIFKTSRLPTVEELCAPLLMSFFEICCSTSQTAYFQHLYGAAKLLEVLGPEKCREGILFELFNTVRLQMLTLLSQTHLQAKATKNYAAIVSRNPSIFCSEEWLTIPFLGRKKDTIDRLVDIITICTGLLARVDAIKASPAFATSNSEKVNIKIHAETLKTQLDEMWMEIQERTGNQGSDRDYFNGIPEVDKPSIDSLTDKHLSSPLETTEQYPPPTSIREPFGSASSTPRRLGFYSTARLLVLAILNQVDATPALYEEQMEAHCASVLSVAEFMSGQDVGYPYLRLMLPLQLVGVLSPRREQRQRARWVLDSWKGAVGMTGICEVAILELGDDDDDDDDGDIDAEGEDEEMLDGGSTRGLSREESFRIKVEDEKEFGYLSCGIMEDI